MSSGGRQSRWDAKEAAPGAAQATAASKPLDGSQPAQVESVRAQQGQAAHPGLGSRNAQDAEAARAGTVQGSSAYGNFRSSGSRVIELAASEHATGADASAQEAGAREDVESRVHAQILAAKERIRAMTSAVSKVREVAAAQQAAGPQYALPVSTGTEQRAAPGNPPEGEFWLPRNQQIVENLDTSKLEQASLDKHIPADNKGYMMLQMMGWRPGRGLGRGGCGRTEPVPLETEAYRRGLGKATIDSKYTAAEHVSRVLLESELQENETEERRAQRAERAAAEAVVKADVAEAKQTFHCDVCNKTYERAMEFDEHLSSYAHHHKKRDKEVRAPAALGE
ncbi:unnamed protein product [Pedinophyceae sp. YPF-701]|nr:unnamed protein product [Pedinophyceae sp. YPF-701]